MKIFIFTDLHGDFKALRKVIKEINSQKPEIIICAGDISIFGDNFFYIVNEIDELGIPFLIIHGNHEDNAMVKKAQQVMNNTINLHKAHYIYKDYIFFGYGGGGFSHVDRQFEDLAKKFKKTIEKTGITKIVLVTHAPPYKTEVDKVHGTYAGNKSIRNFIVETKPVLHVCGHLHENEGKEDTIGKTRIINPGFLGKIVSV
jgi:Icc-related predicted phosphoesterase